MLEVKNITCGYKKNVDVIKDCSFSLDQGETLVLLGKNGAGKSTILKAILGLGKLSSGEILIDDANLKDLSIKEKAKLISYVPQNVTLPPLSVTDTNGRKTQFTYDVWGKVKTEKDYLGNITTNNYNPQDIIKLTFLLYIVYLYDIWYIKE